MGKRCSFTTDIPCEGTARAKARQQDSGTARDLKFRGWSSDLWRGEGLLEQGGTSEAPGVRTVEGLQSLLRDVHFIRRSLRAAQASQGGSSRPASR